MTDDADGEGSAPDLDHAISEVYRGPLEEFVARRDALVKELRAAGRRDDAGMVKALRKPTRTVWALDAAVLDDPETVEKVAEAVTGAIEAQSGGGDLRAAFDRLRTAVRDLSAAAARIAADNGHPIDQSTLVPAASAVVGEPEAFDALRAGRLAAIPPAGGLDLLAGVPLPPTPPLRSTPPQSSAHTRKAAKPAGTKPTGDVGTAGRSEQASAAEVTAAEEHPVEGAAAAAEVSAAGAARSARQALQQAEAEAATVRRRGTEAERALRRAEINAEVADEELRRADRRAHATRSRLEEARQQADAARAREREADEAIARLRDELDQLSE